MITIAPRYGTDDTFGFNTSNPSSIGVRVFRFSA